MKTNSTLRKTKGVLAILFGLIALFFPKITTASLAVLFGLFVIFYGILAILGAIRLRKQGLAWFLLFLEGIFDMLLGIVAIIFPIETLSVLVVLIGVWAIITGLIMLVSYSRKRRFRSPGSFPLFLSILSLLIGLLLLLNPFKSAVFIVILIGIFAITFGLFSFFSPQQS